MIGETGQRITMDGKAGTVIRPLGDPNCLRVRFDGDHFTSRVHPTWRVDYGDVAGVQTKPDPSSGGAVPQ